MDIKHDAFEPLAAESKHQKVMAKVYVGAMSETLLTITLLGPGSPVNLVAKLSACCNLVKHDLATKLLHHTFQVTHPLCVICDGTLPLDLVQPDHM